MTGDILFQGFSDDAVAFLRDLRANNERAWFNDHKTVYERAIKAPAVAFSEAMAGALEALTGVAHGHKIFRIHRDVRFSKDKTPYNTHLHIAFAPKLGRSSPPCWFFGLDPENVMLGAGVFAFDKADLDGFRKRVLGEDGVALQAIMAALEGEGVRFGEPVLKRVPGGYQQDHPAADLLRYKGMSAWVDHPDPAIMTDPACVETCMGDFRRLKPVFDWLSA